MIRLMTLADITRVLELENQLFTSPWGEDDFKYELESNLYSTVFVDEFDDNIVGYVGIWIIFEQAQITTLGVDKSYQHKHIGQALLVHAMEVAVEKHAEVMSLEVRVSNIAAQNLYRKLGFKTETIRKDYYQDNHEDAYLMLVKLGELNEINKNTGN